MGTYEHLKLENQLCFKYYVISKEIIRRYKPLLDPLGLTYTGYIAMLVLWEEDNISVKSLGKILTLDSGTLTPLLKKLESKGYISRVRSEKDERKVMVNLTNKGISLKKEASHIPQAIINNIFGDKVFDEEDAKNKIDALNEVFSLFQ